MQNGALAETATDVDQLLITHAHKEILRFITCGSVDDGKSTLIGRLLLEAGAVYDDQIAALRKDSERHGTTGEQIDTALLVDGLEDERQQGITIDVAYRYFMTRKRKFIIADTPGHEQFTRNMVTGASNADLAIILVDASKGISTQTRRHSLIVSLLSIKHVILAVNKMDLVDYQQAVFAGICAQFRQLAEKLDIPDIRFVPLSALKGDNLVEPSANMIWYEDSSLLHLLETIYVASDRNLQDLRFPVQWVNRPHADFRGFAGTVASGTVRVGDDVVVLPSRKPTRVERIVSMDGDLSEASAPLSITLTLADEIDVARGDMIVRPGNLPHVSRHADVMLVWMSEQPLTPGKPYWCKHTSRRTSADVQQIRYAIDVNTWHRQPVASLKLNEIGRCSLLFHDPVMQDAYSRNRQTGSFILVDRISHETVAAGMFLDKGGDLGGLQHSDEHVETMRLQRSVSRITSAERRQRFAQKPVTVLITGLTGSGKTSTAICLEQQLFASGHTCITLDGQDLRFGLSRDLGFSAEERSENLRRAAEIARLVNDAGQICIASFVAPHQATRHKIRDLIGCERWLHVHLSTPLDVCRRRDTSGGYDAAERGDIASFPGVTFAYEQPADADLVVSTESDAPEQVAAQILGLLKSRGYLA